MNFYICSTPYHLFISLNHLFSNKKKSIFYLTTHDNNSEKIFRNLELKLTKIDLVEKVIIRKRSLIKERLRLEEIKDNLEYAKIKNDLEGSFVYNFPWNPYSLFTLSNFLYKKSKKLIFMEDGSTLYAWPKPSNLKLFIKKYIYGVSTDFYKDKKLERILVQYPEKYPEHLQDKIEKLDVEYLFKRLTEKEKEIIIKIFLPEKEVERLLQLESGEMIIILTQPLSEDGFVSEEEKRKLYKDIIDQYYDNYNIILKKHPREKTTYDFENVIELSGIFPSEIFTMLELKFKKAIGICTSAITLIDAEEKTNTDEDFLRRKKNNE